jgi:hypothetical protein
MPDLDREDGGHGGIDNLDPIDGREPLADAVTP